MSFKWTDGTDYLAHHGIKGQKWGIRRFQNEDGSLTPAGKAKYSNNLDLSKLNRNWLSNLAKKPSNGVGGLKLFRNNSKSRFNDRGQQSKKQTVASAHINDMMKKYGSSTPKMALRDYNSGESSFFAFSSTSSDDGRFDFVELNPNNLSKEDYIRLHKQLNDIMALEFALRNEADGLSYRDLVKVTGDRLNPGIKMQQEIAKKINELKQDIKRSEFKNNYQKEKQRKGTVQNVEIN